MNFIPYPHEQTGAGFLHGKFPLTTHLGSSHPFLLNVLEASFGLDLKNNNLAISVLPTMEPPVGMT